MNELAMRLEGAPSMPVNNFANRMAMIPTPDQEALQDPLIAPETYGLGSLVRKGLLGIGALGMTVYHGSPHKFNAFDTSKIGTGEGAQTYGHGLYFADKPEVANSYANNVRNAVAIYNHPNFAGKNVVMRGDEVVSVHNTAAQANAARDTLRGNMYHVDLPDEHIAKMLDWDKPLAQQEDNIKKALAASGLKLPPNATGEQIHAAISSRAVSRLNPWERGRSGADQVAASEELRAMGIPGIKYLDQESRNAGGWHITPPTSTVSGRWMLKSSDYNSKGIHFDTEKEAQAALNAKIGGQTHNYVVFDDTLPKILKRD